MPAQTALESVDLSKYAFAPECDVCTTNVATNIAQGCADKHPVLMCDTCLDRGLEVIAMFIRMWQRCNKRVFICGDCYRPVLNLDTHLDVRRLHPCPPTSPPAPAPASIAAPETAGCATEHSNDT